MPEMSQQRPSAVVMIRPHHFTSNVQTAADNGFQTTAHQLPEHLVSTRAFDEVTAAAAKLEAVGVTVHLFEDRSKDTPDSVFPNNWFSTHAGGHVAVFPMYSPNRRAERRYDVLEMLKRSYRVQDIIDYSGLEQDQLFLEGTGAMVLDHVERVAYAARSRRTSEVLLERFCTHFNFEPVVFDAADRTGTPIYHTNVLMCIAERYALIGAEAISDIDRRQEVCARLAFGGRDVLELSLEQISEFAGNAIELQGASGSVLAMSARAAACLTDGQRSRIAAHSRILGLEIPTIELAGGSVRCMLAGIHLSARS